LAPKVTMHVSGTAKFFTEANTEDELIEALQWANERNLNSQILAGGSNLIFAMDEYNGLVINLLNRNLQINDDNITVSAGIPVNRLLVAALENSLDGLSSFSGLPGTVGGAIRGNAGCYGTEICDLITKVTILNDNLELEELDAREMNFSYRHSRIKETKEIVLSATFNLTSSNKNYIQTNYIEILRKRLSHQPKGFSSGSFFKNPKPGKIFSGKLIEDSGLKGFSVGDMTVSNEHANYLLNKSKATYSDLLSLKNHIQTTIHDKHNILLEPEVSIITDKDEQ